ncbi:MAG: CvpA family protein [Pseudoflavonifractor sp.]|nr:CvpA family protein [Pseudoflavonifractor sp.]
MSIPIPVPILIDILILVVLLVFLMLGAHHGFILTLCSLVAVLVALIGATLAADALAPKLASALEPRLAQSIQAKLEERALAAGNDAGAQTGVSDVLAALRDKGGLYKWAADKLEDTLEAGITQTAAETAASAAAAVAEQIAHGLLFVVGFLVVLLAWTLLSRALDLVAQLPGLSGLNRAAGGLLGLVKGLLVVYLVAWILCDLTGLLPPETVAQTKLLRFLTAHSPLEMLMLV